MPVQYMTVDIGMGNPIISMHAASAISFLCACVYPIWLTKVIIELIIHTEPPAIHTHGVDVTGSYHKAAVE